LKNRLVTIVAASIVTLATATVGVGSAFAASNATYTVQSGDTLYKITVAQGISLGSLEAANLQITNVSNIYPGEVINLPYTYVVKPGDTFYRIAVAQGVTLSVLEATNPQITNYVNLQVGQVIHIPTPASTQQPTQSAQSAQAAQTPSSTSSSAATSTTFPAPAVSSASERQNIVLYAESLIGTPYAWGGMTPSVGFDCSGFVDYVYAHLGITLPRESHDQATIGTPVLQANLQPGDLLFFHDTDSSASLYPNHVTHVGIYVGSGSMIESSSSHNNEGVAIVNNVFANPYYSAHYYGAQSVLK
jgi:peptidoglycan DL-endopeptidase LytE